MEKKHIVIIGGSVRPENYTMRAVGYLKDELEKQKEPLTFETIDATTLKLALPGHLIEGSSHEMMQEKVKQATGVIIASPEYHGGISSTMKLIIDNLGFPSMLAGKPVALLGVAAGVIGAIKSLEQLRSICSHVGAIVLPGPVSISNVQQLFDDQGRCLDPEVEKRIRGTVKTLVDYIDDHICPRIALENMAREKS